MDRGPDRCCGVAVEQDLDIHLSGERARGGELAEEDLVVIARDAV